MADYRLHLARVAALACVCCAMAGIVRAEEPAAKSAASSTQSAAPPPASSPPPLLARPAPQTAAPETDVPHFRPGMWNYKRTLQSGQGKPQVSIMKKCSDPSAEMRAKLGALSGKGCKFEPPLRSQDHYTSSWSCATQSGVVRFRDVLIVKDDTNYEDRLEMRSSQQVSHQKLEAARIGECTEVVPGVPMTPKHKPAPPPHG